MEKQIPKQFQNIFNTWEEYRLWSIEKSKYYLHQAFENHESKNRK